MDMTGRTIIDKTIQSGDSVIILDKGIYIVMVKADGQQHITKIAIK
jgi:sulfur transfer complex TusBCD TusB component (DsrH family)